MDACYTRAPSVKATMPGREGTALEFGELKDVTLRDVWGNEAQHFTPWLAANMERLSEAIGIPLESEGTEVAVEQFSADIVARNPADGSRVLIENQLEGSDHRHLGQILTYLAGVQAQTVIWVARDFDESHRSAIRWLNDHTEEPFAFFAVRVRVVQIADSPLVPLFEVLERPSAWDRTVRTTVATDTSKRTQFRLDFWTHYAGRHPNDGVSAGHKLSHFWVGIQSAQLYLSAYMAQRSVGVSVRGELGEASEAVLARIQKWEQDLRDKLGVEIGKGTSWGSYAQSRHRIDATDRDKAVRPRTFADCGSRARDRQRKRLDVTTRGAVRRPATAGRVVVGGPCLSGVSYRDVRARKERGHSDTVEADSDVGGGAVVAM